MTKSTARHRKARRDSAGRLTTNLAGLRGILQDAGAIAGLLSAFGILPITPAVPDVQPTTCVVISYLRTPVHPQPDSVLR